ncbi:unnamed protein product [Allacma fusca]|uniref:Uncharacterized protein n=1 Tax=Allacma fusca TaxID=39272 RepID=A0A8J2PH13_9HEXA|nr:unnamed protein product [Allacma fusca]
MVFNVHNIFHLADDCKRYGPLESFSSFPFESHLGYIKRNIRENHHPIQQLRRRIEEKEMIPQEQLLFDEPVFKFEHKLGPCSPKYKEAHDLQEVRRKRDLFICQSEIESSVDEGKRTETYKPINTLENSAEDSSSSEIVSSPEVCRTNKTATGNLPSAPSIAIPSTSASISTIPHFEYINSETLHLRDIQNESQARSSEGGLGTPETQNITLEGIADCPELPIESEDQLNKFELFLIQDGSLVHLPTILSNVGGTSIKETTERILARIITDCFASLYNWKGSVGKTSSGKGTDKEIEEAIKYWLKHGKGRIRGETNLDLMLDVHEGD